MQTVSPEGCCDYNDCSFYDRRVNSKTVGERWRASWDIHIYVADNYANLFIDERRLVR